MRAGIGTIISVYRKPAGASCQVQAVQAVLRVRAIHGDTPMNLSRRNFLTASTALASATLAGLASAQSSAPVRIVIGFAAGGAADFIARQLASHLQLEAAGSR
jgi:hypothetical protein